MARSTASGMTEGPGMARYETPVDKGMFDPITNLLH
jgi:hypothetical protein